MLRKKKVIIIGAGVAGMSSALELIKDFEVELFETKNIHGGRIFSVPERTTGEEIDNGQHVLVGAYNRFLYMLKLFGTDIFLKRQKSLIVPFIDQKGNIFELNTTQLPGKAGILLGLMKFGAISPTSRIILLYLFARIQSGLINYDNLTSYEFLKKYHQNDELILNFWEPIILATLNNTSKDTSANLLIEVLKRAFFSGGDNSNMILPVVGLSQLVDPFKDIFHNHGGILHYQSRVTEILTDNNYCNGIRLDNGDFIEGDYVISTLQPNILKKCLPESVKSTEYFNFLNQIEFSTIINIYIWLSKEFISADFTALLGSTSHWVFNRRNFIINQPRKSEYPGLINLTISGANYLTDIPSEILFRQCFSELKNSFPTLKESDIIHYKVIKDKHATFLASKFTEKIRPSNNTPVTNFFIAGDWTNTGLPATLESAGLSGLYASLQIQKLNI